MSEEGSNCALDALRRANPRLGPDFANAIQAGEAVRDRIVSEQPVRAAAAAKSAGRLRRRAFGLSAAGAVVVVAALIVGVTMLTDGDNGLGATPALAAEAVKKAAADTSAAARSGVIRTVVRIDGEAQVVNAVSWNGEDFALMAQDNPQQQLRYVDGKYYETYGYSVPVEIGDTEHAGQWVHVTDYDEGKTPSTELVAVETPDPRGWLTAARSDLAGAGLLELVSSAVGYTQTQNDDGSVTYAGNLTVGAIQDQNFGVNGLPSASQPTFKVNDPSTPVFVKVTVGADGLIRELALDWTLDLPGEASVWNYTSTYDDLGTAPAITAPDPDHTVTTDNRIGSPVAGEM